ncbi:MAG: trigger factor [Lachnospiraceae bacterium]|jgi:trigger factor|nr:trigger factor [Lachnospiraceae bacterium]
MKKQRIGAIILAGAMVLSMTGCGNNKAKSYSKYVELGEYKGIEYTKEVAEVTDDDIQSKLDSFVNGLKTKEEVTDRAVEDGDIVNIDYVGTMDGEEFEGGSSEGYDLTIGSGSFIDGFETGLIGHKKGEEVSLDLKFPDEYANDPDKAGKDVNFKVTINTISVENTPELTDALVKENTEYDTIDAYKDSIRKELEEQNQTNADNNAKSDVFDKVVKNSKITGYDEEEVKKLIDDEFKNFKQTAESYASYGYSYEDVLSMNGYTSEDSLKEGITNYVKEYLNQKMVLFVLADKEGIKVTDEEIEKEVKTVMDTYSIKSEEEVYNYYGEDYFQVKLLTDKVMKFLMENAKQVESTEADTEETSEDSSEEATEEETTEAASSEEDTEEETTEAAE